MPKLLLDANFSPLTAQYLKMLKYDVKSLLEEGLWNLKDKQVIQLAKEENRAIVTFDYDFAEIWYTTLL